MSANELDAWAARRVLFFDGECVMCNGIVKKVHALDRDRRFEFASLQGESAASLAELYPGFPTELDTFVYWDEGALHVRSRAVLLAAKQLRWPWRMAAWLTLIPRAISDAVYRVVARNRHRWFGRTEECWLPPQDERARFLS